MLNHEVWAECPICGKDFDQRNGSCPECTATSNYEFLLGPGQEFSPTNRDSE